VNQETLVASLRHIRNLASDCLKSMGDDKAIPSEARKVTITTKRASGNALPGRILEIRDKNFFKEPRTAREVHEKLRAAYPCELNRVAMALLRLKGKKKLRKASKLVHGKKQIAYVW
jgi:hypothetical protein